MTASVLSRTLAITLLAASCCAQTENTAYEGVPFEMPRIQLPSIPQRSVCLTDFDAAGDGRASCARILTAAEAEAFSSKQAVLGC